MAFNNEFIGKATKGAKKIVVDLEKLDHKDKLHK